MNDWMKWMIEWNEWMIEWMIEWNNDAFINDDKALWNNLLSLWVRSSTASFNKCFFVNSTWHCASFTKQNTLNNSQTWSGMPLKLNYLLIPYTGNLLIYKGVNELLKPNQIKSNQIKVNVLSLHLSYWRQTQARWLWENAHLKVILIFIYE